MIRFDTKKDLEYYDNLHREIHKKGREIERLNLIIEIKNNRIQQLMKRTRSARIDKAIEYIEKCQLGVDGRDRPVMLKDQEEGKELVDILKGDDKA